MTRTLIAAAALAGLAFPAFAQDSTLDTDGDGYVSVEEMQAMYPDMSADDFAALDTDGDGLLSEEELTAGMEDGSIPMMDEG